MADFRMALPVRQAMASAVASLADAGGAPSRIRIYSGPIPASPVDPLTGATLLADLEMAMPAFLPPDASATISANPITADLAADATGAAGFFRIVDGAGAVLFQGDVSDTAGAGDLKMQSVEISAGIEVSISSLSLTIPEA